MEGCSSSSSSSSSSRSLEPRLIRCSLQCVASLPEASNASFWQARACEKAQPVPAHVSQVDSQGDELVAGQGAGLQQEQHVEVKVPGWDWVGQSEPLQVKTAVGVQPALSQV